MTAAAATTRPRRAVNTSDHAAKALATAAAATEVRRQKSVGEALDLQSALDAVRGGPLDLQAACALAQGDLSRLTIVEWHQDVAVLSDLARVAPDLRIRMEAADRAAQRRFDMVRLVVEQQQGLLPTVPGMTANGTQPAAAPSNLLTREEAIEELKRRRVAQLQGAR